MSDARPLPPEPPLDRLIGHAPAMHTLRTQIHRLAGFDALGGLYVPTVLLHGETGTGKGLVARVLHASGPRAHGPFIDVNCAAIPETMLEAELFGFEAGAFTDAKRAKPGLFEAASGGTLFLDEIDAVPLVLQSKLLTILEEKRVRRLGAVADRAVDVKLVAATSADLPARVAEGRFRLDLYHRLAVVLLELPPLRVRGEDIVVLAKQFLAQYAAGHRVAPKRLGPTAEAWLARQAWPGNVRELSHLMERVTLLHPEDVIEAAALERFCLPRSPGESVRGAAPSPTAAEGVDEPVRIRQALIRTGGNVVRAAQLLGLRRDALRYRMRRYGIRPLSLAELSAAPPPADPGDQRDVLRVAADGPGGMASSASPESPFTWEQKPVAILAIDLTWPEPSAQESPPYEPWTVVARWEQGIVEKVQGFGGVVLYHTPSLLLVAFGIPRTLDQQPQRAVHAALALRQLGLGEGPSTGNGARPALRLGLHWGPLLVAPQAPAPPSIRAVGDTLAVPVRLLGQAASGEVLASAAMGRLVARWCALQPRRDAGDTASSAPVSAYRLTGAQSERLQPAGRAPRPLRPFVGRARELAVLAAAWARARAGQGQVVGIVGEPGIGKSRLLAEFLGTSQPTGARVLETRALAYTQTTPYRPIVDLLRGACGIHERDDGPTVRAKVTHQLAHVDLPREAVRSPLLSLLEGPLDDPTWPTLDPSLRRQRTFEAVRQILRGESRVQPLIVVCEDLHWSDHETQAVLDRLVDGLTEVPLLLLVTARPESPPAWGGQAAYTALRLEPLPHAHTTVLLEEWLGMDATLPPLTSRLIERAQGNPFFLEESVHTLLDTGMLVGRPGAYALAQPVDRLQVPATVHAVLAARIDRLPPQEKALLQTAAVIGHEVPFPVLQALAEGSEDALHRSLAHLQAAEFLYETRLFPECEYRFKHALTHEVAYGSLLPERRRSLHARMVEVLERSSADPLAEPVERLAHHALRGEVWGKAVAYGRRAGARAWDRAAFREAVAAFEQALQAQPFQHGYLCASSLAVEICLPF